VGDRKRIVLAPATEPGGTEIEKLPNRGHSLTIDSGWREVAERALAFVKRFVGGATEARASDEAH
jgi:hypothetical protein